MKSKLSGLGCLDDLNMGHCAVVFLSNHTGNSVLITNSKTNVQTNPLLI